MYSDYTDTGRKQSCSEDPWDVSRGSGGARGRIAASLRGPLWLGWIAATLLFLLLAWSTQVTAQSILPRPPDVEKGQDKATANNRIRVTLKADAGELARDYLALLEQLKALTDDYSSYYSDFHLKQSAELEKEMRQLSRQLSDSAYYRNFTTLTFDLDRLQLALRKQETKLAQLTRTNSPVGKHSDESANPKLRKITRTLRRELEMLNDQLEDDIGERMRASAAKSAIVQQYIKACVATMKDNGLSDEHTVAVNGGDHDNTAMIVLELDLTNLTNLDELLQNCEQAEIATVSAPPQPTDIYDLPEFPPPPPIPGTPPIRLEDKRTAFHQSSGEAGMTLQFVDSTHIGTTATPVFVVNPMGSLEVEGWDRQWILVDAKIELSAKSDEKADDLAENIDVRIHNRDNGVYVELVLPRLNDPETSILSSSIKIKAPRDNPLSCRNSHGRLVVKDFDNDVKLSADHCDVKISAVDGKVEVVNRMGYLTITNVSGRLELKNTQGPVTVAECRGDMTIENRYASVDIKDCSGQAQVSNSGSVDVIGFAGDLQINNDNGTVMVRDLDGSLEITNSLQPVVIRDIRGPAGLQNERGAIQVNHIDGPLSASTTYGTISAGSLSGPLQLLNTNGEIDLAIDQTILGRSSIMADNSTIKLRLDESADVLLTAETIGGGITSAFPSPVLNTDSSSTTRLELGSMDAFVDISGYSTDVVIKSAQ